MNGIKSLDTQSPIPTRRAVRAELFALIRPRLTLLAIGLLLLTISRVCGLAIPLSTKFLIDDVLGKRHPSMLQSLVAAILAATIIQVISGYSVNQLLSKTSLRVVAELRKKVQRHITRLPITFHDANKTGTLVARVLRDVESLHTLFGSGFLGFIGGLLSSLCVVIFLFRISPSLTVIVLTLIAGFALVVKYVLALVRPMFRKGNEIYGEVAGRLAESLSGIRVVKGYRAEDREAQTFAQGLERLLANSLRSVTIVSRLSTAGTTMLGLIGALVIYLGANQIFAGTLTLGSLATFILLLGFLISPLFNIVTIGSTLTEAVAGLERVAEILAYTVEDDEPSRINELLDVHGTVAFENVSFAYEPGNLVLEHISFNAESGSITALVGPSGAGKSTIIGLIAAFYKPTAGRILVDGIDLSSIKLSCYRTQLGVVFQEPFLFDGTIRENIAFSRTDATEDEILEACRIARVDEFVERFEKKYDTIVGERGVRLSGGQKQRLSIARAILANPRILILDEATSSLDVESEAFVQEGLRHLMRGRTTFVIAHRLSTIRIADQILVIEAGRITEFGTHESLYQARGRYYSLHTKQEDLERNLFRPAAQEQAVETEEMNITNAESVQRLSSSLLGL